MSQPACKSEIQTQTTTKVILGYGFSWITMMSQPELGNSRAMMSQPASWIAISDDCPGCEFHNWIIIIFPTMLKKY